MLAKTKTWKQLYKNVKKQFNFSSTSLKFYGVERQKSRENSSKRYVEDTCWLTTAFDLCLENSCLEQSFECPSSVHSGKALHLKRFGCFTFTTFTYSQLAVFWILFRKFVYKIFDNNKIAETDGKLAVVLEAII